MALEEGKIMGRAKGGWTAYPEMDPNAQVTWAQIISKVDEILAEDRPRRHRFSDLPEGDERPKETITILPHGARRIKVHWPEEMS